MVELAFSSYCHALFGPVQCKTYYKIDRMAFPHTFLRHLMGPRDLLIYRPLFQDHIACHIPLMEKKGTSASPATAFASTHSFSRG